MFDCTLEIFSFLLPSVLTFRVRKPLLRCLVGLGLEIFYFEPVSPQ